MFPKFMLGYIVTVIEPKKLESVILHTKGWYRKVFETHPKMSRCDERPSLLCVTRRDPRYIRRGAARIAARLLPSF